MREIGIIGWNNMWVHIYDRFPAFGPFRQPCYFSPMKFFPAFLCVGLWIGCTLVRPAQQAIPPLVVLASKLYPSATYENFMKPYAEIEWLDASRMDEEMLANAIEVADGILLTGGPDIHPIHYGQAQDTLVCGDIDADRDALERTLLRAVDSLHLPCLGICRGLQHMNVHLGGSLHPHLPAVLGTDLHRAGETGNSRDTLHSVVALFDGGIPGLLAGQTSVVTSHHHQGIARLASQLEPWAVSPDGLIEAVRRRDTIAFPFYIGVQWHPERSSFDQPLVAPIAGSFVQAMLSAH
jgi:putative glutamine amidotransferase